MSESPFVRAGGQVRGRSRSAQLIIGRANDQRGYEESCLEFSNFKLQNSRMKIIECQKCEKMKMKKIN